MATKAQQEAEIDQLKRDLFASRYSAEVWRERAAHYDKGRTKAAADAVSWKERCEQLSSRAQAPQEGEARYRLVTARAGISNTLDILRAALAAAEGTKDNLG